MKEFNSLGPWEAELVPTQIGSMYKFPPSGAVMYVDGMFLRNSKDLAWKEAHAVARLIAAAPELLEALHKAVEVMQFAYMNAPEQPKEIAESLKAIAKAEGGES